MHIPLSTQLKKLNKELGSQNNQMILLELDGISEMLVNYVKSSDETAARLKYISTLMMFLTQYSYLCKPENLNVIKIILLNELYKKNSTDLSVMMLIKNEMRFNHQDASVYKAIIEKELREICMREYDITSVSDPNYRAIVKPMIKNYEDFYYSFR